MLITLDSLVISRREFGETSCFIDVLTEEYGVIEVVAKGVKKLNSPFASSTGIFTYSTFCLNKKNLRYTLNSAKCKNSFHQLSDDLISLSLAAYFAELVKFTQPPEQSSGEVLKMMLIALTELEHGIEHGRVKSDFEYKLIHALGIAHPELQVEHSERYLLNSLDRGFRTLDYFKSLM